MPQFWAQTQQSGMFGKLCEMESKEPCGVLGVSSCMNGQDFDYYIAVATDAPVPEGMAEYTVPKADWAVFPCTGPIPHAYNSFKKRIISEWLPLRKKA